MPIRENYTKSILSDNRKTVDDMIKFQNARSQESKLQFNVFTTDGEDSKLIMQLKKESELHNGMTEVFVWDQASKFHDDANFDLPYVYDLPFRFAECPPEFLKPSGTYIDGYSYPSSSCAEAIEELVSIYDEKYENLHATIVGCNECVRGLRDRLINLDFAVSQCTYYTLNRTLSTLIRCADVVVWAYGSFCNIPMVKMQPRSVFINVFECKNINEFKELNPDTTFYSSSEILELTSAVIFRRVASEGGIVNEQ